MFRLLLVLFFMPVLLSAQSKRDYSWQYRGTEMNFKDTRVNLYLRETQIAPFDVTTSSICDKEGELLFYTNGCRVANRIHQMMPHGDSINNGPYFEIWSNGCEDGNRDRQGVVILPDPKSEEGYYIIHKPREYDEENTLFWQEYLRYSYVDMSLDNGLGDVTEKNIAFFQSRMKFSHLTAMKHANGKDWWIMNPSDAGGVYYRILLTENGFEKIDSQYIGPIFSELSSSGESKFSPDGKLYAYFNLQDGLQLYDYDRETGLLSGGRYMAWNPEMLYSSLGGIEFSPDSKMIYFADGGHLYQVDLSHQDLNQSIELISELDSEDFFIYGFSFLALGPDCKIYSRFPSSTYYFHVINEPNKKGKECDFIQLPDSGWMRTSHVAKTILQKL